MAPTSAERHAEEGVVLGRAGRHAAAAGRFREAVRLWPGFAAGWYNLGLALVETKQFTEAADAFGRACTLRLDEPAAFVRRGAVLQRLGRPAGAVAALRRAVDIRPEHAEAWRILAGADGEQGRYKEAAECYRRAAEIEPGHFLTASDYLHLLHYDPNVGREQLLEVAKAWDGQFAEPLPAGR